MSKKLLILIQAFLALTVGAKAYAQQATYDVYEYGQYKGTMTGPVRSYSNLNGTGITLRRQADNEDQRRARMVAAQAREAQFKQEDEVRHNAALRQQEQWNQDFETRHQAAVARQEQFKRDNEARRISAQERMAEWNRQFDARHQAALQGFDAWSQSR